MKRNFIVIATVLINILYFQLCFGLEKVTIFAKIDNKIITNQDLNLEINYLKLLNPEIKKLSKLQIIEIAKKSLINESIKKSEIELRRNINENVKNKFLEDSIKNLLARLNLNSLEELENELKLKKTYNLDKLKEKIEIELDWNNLIYSKYISLVNIDKKEIVKKINKLDDRPKKKFFLSEILYAKDENLSLDDLLEKIKVSIEKIGFSNTANIYSISNSSKIGGKIGWVNESNLSKLIIDELNLTKKGSYTRPIKLGNNYLIINVEDIEIVKESIDKEKEIEKLIQFETDKQLSKFSRIFFDKAKINYNIYER